MQPTCAGSMLRSTRVRGVSPHGRREPAKDESALHRITRVIPRVCWLMLIVVHLPALFSVGRQFVDMPGAARGGSLLALLATIAIFALKACDVSWLRLRGGRASTLILFLVLCAVAHPQVMATVFRHAPAVTGSIVVTQIAALRIPTLWRRSWRDWASRITPRRSLILANCVRFVRIPPLRDLSLAVTTLSRVPRAPPCAS